MLKFTRTSLTGIVTLKSLDIANAYSVFFLLRTLNNDNSLRVLTIAIAMQVLLQWAVLTF